MNRVHGISQRPRHSRSRQTQLNIHRLLEHTVPTPQLESAKDVAADNSATGTTVAGVAAFQPEQLNSPPEFNGLWGKIFARGFGQGPAAANNDRQTNFLDLPLEIRSMIYRYAMDELPNTLIVHNYPGLRELGAGSGKSIAEMFPDGDESEVDEDGISVPSSNAESWDEDCYNDTDDDDSSDEDNEDNEDDDGDEGDEGDGGDEDGVQEDNDDDQNDEGDEDENHEDGDNDDDDVKDDEWSEWCKRESNRVRQWQWVQIHKWNKKRFGRVPLPELSTALLSKTLPALSFASRGVLYESMLVYLQRTRFILPSPQISFLEKIHSFVRQFPAGQGFASIRELELRFNHAQDFERWNTTFLFEKLSGLRRVVVSSYGLFETLAESPSGRKLRPLRLTTMDEFRERHQSYKFYRLYEAKALEELVVHIAGLTRYDFRPAALAMLLQVLKEERDIHGKDVKLRPIIVKNQESPGRIKEVLEEL